VNSLNSGTKQIKRKKEERKKERKNEKRNKEAWMCKKLAISGRGGMERRRCT
jgi:hypothetical protein